MIVSLVFLRNAQKLTMQISYSLSTIHQAAYQLWQYGYKFNVWTFVGDMGAGKTTLISTVCKTLGVKDTVSSPTFGLINEYGFEEAGQTHIIYHMDWYRIQSTEEAIQAGIEDALYQPDAYSWIEWPEKAPELLHKPYLEIQIEIISETERTMTLVEKEHA
jgi:tRNA threonylcarbamoyladenosine biosynthesis protein TsaE